MSELKPCPFCGGKPHVGLSKVWHDQLHGDAHQDVLVWCSVGGLGYDGSHAKIRRRTREDAISEWNTRHTQPPADVRGLQEEMVGYLDELIEHGLYKGPLLSFWCNRRSSLQAALRAQPDAKEGETFGRDILNGGGAVFKPAATPIAPIVKISVALGKIEDASFYSPGLPDGEHDLFCEPVGPGQWVPSMFAQPAATPADGKVAREVCHRCHGKKITKYSKREYVLCRHCNGTGNEPARITETKPGAPDA